MFLSTARGELCESAHSVAIYVSSDILGSHRGRCTRIEFSEPGVNRVDKSKQKRLEAAGWKVGDASEVLELSPEEMEYVELKLALGNYLRDIRRERRWTQTQLAKRLGSSQSRVAKMEVADCSVTVDLLVKSLFSIGASPKDVGRVISAV